MLSYICTRRFLQPVSVDGGYLKSINYHNFSNLITRQIILICTVIFKVFAFHSTETLFPGVRPPARSRSTPRKYSKNELLRTASRLSSATEKDMLVASNTCVLFVTA